MSDHRPNAGKQTRPLLAWHRPQAGRDRGTVLPMWGLCPLGEPLTAYDRRHLRLYASLLIAFEDGASVEDLAMAFFGFDLERQREWGLRVTLSHLRRAGLIQELRFPTID